MLGRQQCRDLLDGFLHARGDQAVEGVSGEFTVDGNNRSLRDAEEDPEVDLHLLQVGGETVGRHRPGALTDIDPDDAGDERGLEPEALGQESVLGFPQSHLEPTGARFDDIGGGVDDEQRDEESDAGGDPTRGGLRAHGVSACWNEWSGWRMRQRPQCVTRKPELQSSAP